MTEEEKDPDVVACIQAVNRLEVRMNQLESKHHRCHMRANDVKKLIMNLELKLRHHITPRRQFEELQRELIETVERFTYVPDND